MNESTGCLDHLKWKFKSKYYWIAYHITVVAVACISADQHRIRCFILSQGRVSLGCSAVVVDNFNSVVLEAPKWAFACCWSCWSFGFALDQAWSCCQSFDGAAGCCSAIAGAWPVRCHREPLAAVVLVEFDSTRTADWQNPFLLSFCPPSPNSFSFGSECQHWLVVVFHGSIVFTRSVAGFESRPGWRRCWHCTVTSVTSFTSASSAFCFPPFENEFESFIKLFII